MKKYSRAQLNAMDPEAMYKFAKNELGIPGVAMLGNDEILNAVLAHMSQKGLLTDAEEPAAVPEQPRDVKVSYPPYEQNMPVAGKTIAYIYGQLKEAWSMGADVRCFVNGAAVAISSEVVVEAGQTVEFGKPAGEKGV